MPQNHHGLPNTDMDACYCGSRMPAAQCCLPYLYGSRPAPTPEALMRSRYCAFCTGNVEYLLNTHSAATTDQFLREQLDATIKTTQWVGLRVLGSRADGDVGEVEFLAGFKSAGRFGLMHEQSTFRREQDRWFYVSGRHLPPPKLQRNDACWCGSGKKFKKCCGA